MNRLYRLNCGVQHYPWGGRRHAERGPFIAELLGLAKPGDKPYAELWIGAHPKMPAQVMCDGTELPLNAFIEQAPEQVLGPALTDRNITELPFLLKVLNCEQPLSIQAHPDVELARQLHARDPAHYPDANHKPEIAVAVTEFKALCQFRDRTAIAADIARHLPLRDFFAALTADSAQPAWLKMAYSHLFQAAAAKMHELLQRQRIAVEQATSVTGEDDCFMELLAQNPGDRGCLSAYFLNLLMLQPGEALFLGANEPHAYLSGTIIECMANSDNVVRAGLTPKFIDTETLLQMLTYREGYPDVWRGEASAPGIQSYIPPVDEFRISFIQPAPGMAPLSCNAAGRLSLLLVLDGTAQFSWHGAELVAERGSSWLWPGSLPEISMTATERNTTIVRATANFAG